MEPPEAELLMELMLHILDLREPRELGELGGVWGGTKEEIWSLHYSNNTFVRVLICSFGSKCNTHLKNDSVKLYLETHNWFYIYLNSFNSIQNASLTTAKVNKLRCNHFDTIRKKAMSKLKK